MTSRACYYRFIVLAIAVAKHRETPWARHVGVSQVGRPLEHPTPIWPGDPIIKLPLGKGMLGTQLGAREAQ